MAWAANKASVVTGTVIAATILAGLAIIPAGPLQIVRPPPGNPLCSNTRIPVCLWPESVKYLEPASNMAERAADLGNDVLTVPDAFYELGVRARGWSVRASS